MSFLPLTDTLGVYTGTDPVSLRIGALAVQPGGTGVILAGTGDPNDASDSYYGAGIFRSADGGVTRSLIVQTKDTVFGTSLYFRLLREQLCRLRLEHQQPEYGGGSSFFRVRWGQSQRRRGCNQ